VRKSLHQKKTNVSNVLEAASTKPSTKASKPSTKPSKRQSLTSPTTPTSQSLSSTSKRAKINIVSTDILSEAEILKKKHVSVVGKKVLKKNEVTNKLTKSKSVIDDDINVIGLDMRQYAECDLSLSEKTSICMWHNKLCDHPGATSSMVECLEMFIKLSNDIVSEDGLDIPARLTWMDGLLGNDAVKDDGKDKFGFKVLFY